MVCKDNDIHIEFNGGYLIQHFANYDNTLILKQQGEVLNITNSNLSFEDATLNPHETKYFALSFDNYFIEIDKVEDDIEKCYTSNFVIIKISFNPVSIFY